MTSGIGNVEIDPRLMTPAQVRGRIRNGQLPVPTAGFSDGYMQGNLAILPAAHAGDFMRYCLLNPKSCPVLAIGQPGNPSLPALGDIDIRTDIAFYRVFRNGVAEEETEDLGKLWRDDLVSFVLGCSFSFESALTRAGIVVPHIAAERNAPMYITNIQTQEAGPFGGPLVVSMRAFSPEDAIQAIVLSERYPLAHGAPVHIGDPGRIGIGDVHRPDFGDAPLIGEGQVPVFWACGVTPQMAIGTARPDLAITHMPGFMLVTDMLAENASPGQSLRHPGWPATSHERIS